MEIFTVLTVNMLSIAKDLKSLTKLFKAVITKMLTSKSAVIMGTATKKSIIVAGVKGSCVDGLWNKCLLAEGAAIVMTVSMATTRDDPDLHATLHFSDPDLLLLSHICYLGGAVGLWVEAGGCDCHVTVHQDCISYVSLIGVHPVVTRWQFWVCNMQVTTCLGREVPSSIRSPEPLPLVLECFIGLHDDSAALAVIEICAKHTCWLISTKWIRSLKIKISNAQQTA